MTYTPKRSSDNYVQLKKKITNKEVIKILHLLSEEWFLSPPQVCYRIINEAAAKEMKKKQQMAEIKSITK